MTTLLEEIVQILVGGITGIATGIGSGLQTLAKDIFVVVTTGESGTTYSLSVFGGLIIVFAGIGLAVGLSRWFMNWITSLGN